jgi:hypothetical protein
MQCKSQRVGVAHALRAVGALSLDSQTLASRMMLESPR